MSNSPKDIVLVGIKFGCVFFPRLFPGHVMNWLKDSVYQVTVTNVGMNSCPSLSYLRDTFSDCSITILDACSGRFESPNDSFDFIP